MKYRILKYLDLHPGIPTTMEMRGDLELTKRHEHTLFNVEFHSLRTNGYVNYDNTITKKGIDFLNQHEQAHNQELSP